MPVLITYLKAAKRVNLKSSHYKKKHIFQLCIMMDVNYTYYGDHFAYIQT